LSESSLGSEESKADEEIFEEAKTLPPHLRRLQMQNNHIDFQSFLINNHAAIQFLLEHNLQLILIVFGSFTATEQN